MRQIYILVFVLICGCASVKKDTSQPVVKKDTASEQTATDSVKTNVSKNMNLDKSYYYVAEFGDAIDIVAKKFGITEEQLRKWNPELDPQLSGFWGGEKLIIKDPNK